MNARQKEAYLEQAVKLGLHPAKLKEFGLLTATPGNRWARDSDPEMDLLMDIQKINISR